jgi:hypothetical protein
VTAKKATIGSLIDALHAKKAEIKAIEADQKKLEDQAAEIKLKILERMTAEGMKAGTGKLAAAAVKETVVPQVVDWDKFYAFIHDNRFYHLLQRRPSTPGCAELFDSQEIPGVEKFKKIDISLRSL